MSNNSHTSIAEDRSLELDDSEMLALVEQSMARIVEHIGSLETAPAHDLDDAAELALSLIEPMPWEGAPVGDLLDHLFKTVVPKSLTTPGPGFMAYIPGGGIFHAAVADLIANSVNRYVGASAPAPLLARLEANVVDWFVELVGFPADGGGFLSPGGSLANFSAVVAAREKHVEDLQNATVYASDQVHHSVVKAARMAGVRTENIRSVASDGRYRIDCGVLQRQISDDREAGKTPFLVVGSAGTTNTGAVDDLPALAQIATDNACWLHIDAAYGGFFMLTERGRKTLAGIELADSVTLDPHKGMFLPYGTGALVVKDVEALREAHSLPADYLPEFSGDRKLVDFCEISPELSRDARGLRIWLPVKMHGFGVFRANLDEKLDLIGVATDRLRGIPGVEIVADPQLTVVAFRLVAPDGCDIEQANALNRSFLDAINGRNRIHITGTLLRGQFVLRICILSFRTHLERVLTGLSDIEAAAVEVL